MSEYWQGMFASAFAVAVLYVVLNMIGTAVMYSETRTDEKMSACIANGYTYGECYNTISRGGEPFNR